MPRCWKCGGTDLAPLLGDKYQCNEDGNVTDASTGKGPAEGLFSNNDMLGSACVDFMKAHHPEEYRLIADTTAGQPDPGTEPGGKPVTDTMPTDEPVETDEPTEETETEETPTSQEALA